MASTGGNRIVLGNMGDQQMGSTAADDVVTVLPCGNQTRDITAHHGVKGIHDSLHPFNRQTGNLFDLRRVMHYYPLHRLPVSP